MYAVLFRTSLAEESEASVCSQHLCTVTSRMVVPANATVIGRYSVLPYYDELSQDLARVNSQLINSPRDHRWIADVMEWANGALSGMTPRTWDSGWHRLPPGAFVVKGRTNSRKHQWATHMYAATATDVPTVIGRLLDDALIRDQGVVVREYVPLRKLGEGVNGLPVTNEWRTFWLAHNGVVTCLAKGYYWRGSHPETEQGAVYSPQAEALVCDRLCGSAGEGPRFFALDLAETVTGDWIVVEVNDGQMSGLCGCDPVELYANLALSLRAA